MNANTSHYSLVKAVSQDYRLPCWRTPISRHTVWLVAYLLPICSSSPHNSQLTTHKEEQTAHCPQGKELKEKYEPAPSLTNFSPSQSFSRVIRKTARKAIGLQKSNLHLHVIYISFLTLTLLTIF